jgi:PAS domain-containing protein
MYPTVLWTLSRDTVCTQEPSLERKPATDEEDTRYRSVVDNVIDGIITIDETGRIESFNPAASSIFGYANDEVIGHNVKC